MILSIMGIKEKKFCFCAQIVMLTLVACTSSVQSGSLFCPTSSLSPQTPTSVHSLRPADVSVISALFLSDVERSDEINALNILLEIFFTFNPNVSCFVPKQRSIMDQTEIITQSLSSTQWKLLLFFVLVDEPCVCEGQDIEASLNETVSRVENELSSLHKQLKHTLVHVVVWGRLPTSESPSRDCQCQCEEEYSINRRRLNTVTLMASLQESLSAVLKINGWFSKQEDFSVMLQSSPVHIDLSASMKAATLDVSKQALQLWLNLLQAVTNKTEMEGLGYIPCPAEEKPYLRTQQNSPEPEADVLTLDPVMGTKLPCEDRSPSPTVPTSVHYLRPADIKVVAAIGDSLTTGNGVGAAQNDQLGLITQYRGLSWSIGGDKDLSSVTTLPNILKEFNPSLVGYSLGEGDEKSAQSFLNQAVAEANSDDLVNQACAVISRMKSDSRIDFQNDWKLITVYIGARDMCDFCSDTVYFSPDNFGRRIREALDILHSEVPRALVNLVELMNVVPLRRLHQDLSIGCPTWMSKMVCPCVLEPEDGSYEVQRMEDFNKAYQRVMVELVESGRYDTHENFTVVLQRFFRNVSLPLMKDGRPDRSHFSPNCVHLSQKSHTLMAQALWNDMLQPLGNKTDYTPDVPLVCPDESIPFLRTYLNSNYTYETPPPTPSPPTNWGSDFSCEDTEPSESVPISVHRLRPGDIKIVAALGDAVTVGFGVKAINLLQLFNNERGVSWSIGGDETLETVTTLPNILKKFNPSVFGFSKGTNEQTKGFNVAVTGAQARDVPEQMRDLITALNSSDKVNFEEDWKLVTLFIGINDLCLHCHDPDSLSPQKYIGHIAESLDMLYNEVPRVLVNLVEIPEMKDFHLVHKNTLGCSLVHESMCPCFLDPEEKSPEMKKINREFQTETERLVYGGRYDGREDFAVVLQPFFKNSVIPMTEDGTPDLNNFSVDCAHFSERAHAEFAIGLWNNMLEPVGSKLTYHDFTHDRSKIHCPTKEHPFIFTILNSVSGNSGVSTTAVPNTQPTQALQPLLIVEIKESDEIKALNMLSEIFFTFNPDVLSFVPEQRSIMDQAESITQSLSSTQWKLLLFFVPVDEPCACGGQDISATLNETLSRVENELSSLHKQLKHTLVHVVVWGRLPTSESPSRVCQCQCEEEYSINRRRLNTVILMASVQEYLGAVLKFNGWFSEREDFSVMLQSSPVHTDLSASMKAATHDCSQDGSHDVSKHALQLWLNLLQPVTDETEMVGLGYLPCPAEEKPYLRTQHNSPELKADLPILDPVMGTELPCEDRSPSPTVPTSVHYLRPADIKVVAAIGDSLTAGNGVGAAQSDLLGVITQYRGLSWSIGGDKNLKAVTTLPNILKEFNPSLVGYSLGEGDENSEQSFLNQAVTEANSDDLVNQAHAVISRMKSDSRIDFQNDWKVITVYIGARDMCDFCSDTVYYSPDNIVKHIREALDILHSQVPRALVNLVELQYIIPLRHLHQDLSIDCPTWLSKMMCPCVIEPEDGSYEFQRLEDFNKAYQRVMVELVESGRYDTHENFTVVLQPFFRNVSLPLLEDGRPDRSLFSPDCVRLSQKAHTLMAQALWNNMLQPLGNKTDYTPDVPLICPDESIPFLRTYLNSYYTYEIPPPTPSPPTNWGSDFYCEDTEPSESVPTSVHRLRPGDIKIVAALGDSITVGLGVKAKNLLQLFNEERGVSWSIGGDETLGTVTTLPNILKKFNPNVFGFSKGTHEQTKGFNVAVSEAQARDVPEQVRDLITALSSSDKVNFEEDWKLVTLFIGINDLCLHCHDPDSLSPWMYISHITESLDMLYNEVPRVLVNLVEIPELKDIRLVNNDTLGCSLVHKTMCPCFLDLEEKSPELREMKKINSDFQMETERLVYGGRYDGREDFAVVLQPFFKNSVVPMTEGGTPDLNFFSVDCAHFSERGHAEMAIGLWNNMLEPEGSKLTYHDFTHDRSKIHCPTKEHPFIFTMLNSVSGVSTTAVPNTHPTQAPQHPLIKQIKG
nr:phospholipase B1, membrane-associated-like [Misgurnus anguillicaudatus]